MGDCIYCGKPAGRLRKQHPRCHEIHLQGREQFVANVLAAVDGECPLDQLEDMLIRVRASHYIRKEHVRPLLVRAWETAVERALEDTFLSEREERTLTGLAEYFGLSQDDLDRQGAYTRLVKLGVLQ